MKLTICFDDVSLPLPPMAAPDIRQMVIETVLDMAAEAGVDDVVLVAALALHRRMTEDELRHALGDRVYDAFAPHGLLTQHDAEDPDNLIHLGQTDQGEDVEINKRAATSDLLVYVNINLVAMDGGHKSVATGLASYRSLRHHHNPADHAPLQVVHGQRRLGAALVQLAHGPPDRRLRGSRSSRSRPRSTTTPSRPTSPSSRSASGNGRCGTGPPTRPPRPRWPRRHRAWPARSSTPSGRPTP